MLNFYGRRSPRNTKLRELEELKSSIFFINRSKISELNKIIKLKKTVNLEIGFGEGLNIFHQSMKNKEIIFFGCDPYIKGSLNLKKEVEKNEMKNLFFSNLTFNEILAKKTKFLFETVTILFPDPWPKKKHKKRRLINKDFVERLSSLTQDDTNIIVSTDCDDYLNQILYSFYINKDFTLSTSFIGDEIIKRFCIQVTKYYKKAQTREKRSYFLLFKKKKIKKIY